MASSLMAAKMHKEVQSTTNDQYQKLITKERQVKIKLKNERMAERAQIRREKWVRANSQN